MSDNLNHLLVERPEPGLMVVRFNRPEVHNALNTATSQDLLQVFGKLAFTPGDVRCVILSASGEKAFSAGGDLKERQGMTDDAWRLQHAIIEEAAYSIINCSVPVICAVNGIAYGGGCELALCCDFIYAARHARFALPEVTRGIMPGAGATQNLPRAVGVRRAKEIIMSGLPFSADQAQQWGMVNEVCEPAELMPKVMSLAKTICDNAPISVRQIKKAINVSTQTDLTTGHAFEIHAYERMISTEDRHDGVRAFNEKRKPQFKGR